MPPWAKSWVLGRAACLPKLLAQATPQAEGGGGLQAEGGDVRVAGPEEAATVAGRCFGRAVLIERRRRLPEQASHVVVVAKIMKDRASRSCTLKGH